MSADARMARAIIEVREQLCKQPVPEPLHATVNRLIDEAMDGIHLTEFNRLAAENLTNPDMVTWENFGTAVAFAAKYAGRVTALRHAVMLLES